MIVMSETDLRSISIITIIILTMINFIPEDSNKIVWNDICQMRNHSKTRINIS